MSPASPQPAFPFCAVVSNSPPDSCPSHQHPQGLCAANLLCSQHRAHCSGELEIKAVSGETGMLVAELVGQLSVTSGIPESAPLLGFWMPCWVSSSQPAVWAISSPAQNGLCHLRANPRTPALLGNFACG